MRAGTVTIGEAPVGGVGGMAERLTSIRDKAELRVALEGAPNPDEPPSEVVGSDRVIWKNYCRYYRKRLDSIAEDFKRKGAARHRPPRCFDSYCEALGKSRQRSVTPRVPLGEPDERGFKKAVLPERGSAKSGRGPSGLVLKAPPPGDHAVTAGAGATPPAREETPPAPEEAPVAAGAADPNPPGESGASSFAG